MIIFGLHVETNRKLINLRVISTTYYLYKTSSRITRLSNNIPCFHFKQYTLFSLQTIYPVFTSNITFFSKSLSTFKKSILQIIRPSPSSTYNCDIITRELNTLPVYVMDHLKSRNGYWHNLSLFTPLPQYFKWKIYSPEHCFNNNQK